VVDIRSRRAFRRQHIPGSHNIPKPLLVSSELPQEDLILVDQNGMASADLIEDLHDLGHHRLIRHLSGGLDQWEKKGFPLAQQEGAGILLKSDVLPWRPVLIAAALLLTLQHPTIGLLILSLAVAATAFRSESALHRHPMH
jgi:rhodanese-related sulfurtransferase